MYQVKSSNDAIKRAEMKQQVKLKFIEDENDEMLCKCLCGLNVTVDDVLTALEYIKESRLGQFLFAKLRLVIDFRKMSKENLKLKCMIASYCSILQATQKGGYNHCASGCHRGRNRK